MRYKIFLATLFYIQAAVGAAQTGLLPLREQYSAAVYRHADDRLYLCQFRQRLNNTEVEPRLLAVNPYTTAVEHAWPLKQVVSTLALSADESVLYGAVRDSIFWDNFQTGAFDLGFDSQLPDTAIWEAKQMLPLPNHPETLVVVWLAWGQRVLAVYDHGRRRPTLSRAAVDYCLAATDGAVVYAYDYREEATSNLLTLDLTPNGLSPRPHQYTRLKAKLFGLQCRNGRLFTSDGSVLQAAEGGHFYKLGVLPSSEDDLEIAPNSLDSNTLQVCAVSVDRLTWQVFDARNFELLREEPLLSLPPYAGFIDDVVPLSTSKTVAVFELDYLYLTAPCLLPDKAPTGVEYLSSVFPQPSIQREGLRLTSSASYGNQWFWNGQALPAETEQELNNLKSGIYTVEVTVEGCPVYRSQPFRVD